MIIYSKIKIFTKTWKPSRDRKVCPGRRHGNTGARTLHWQHLFLLPLSAAGATVICLSLSTVTTTVTTTDYSNRKTAGPYFSSGQ